MIFPEFLECTKDFDITSRWQLVYHNSTSISDTDVAPAEQTPEDSRRVPAQWQLILPQMKKEMFVTWLHPPLFTPGHFYIWQY